MPSPNETTSSTDKPRHLYEYAVFRFVPDIERGEFVNIGLIMMCKRQRWIKTKFSINREKIKPFDANDTLTTVENQINGITTVADGQNHLSPIARLEPHERFRWLTAVRSASIQTSPTHAGLTDTLDQTFDHLFTTLVL